MKKSNSSLLIAATAALLLALPLSASAHSSRHHHHKGCGHKVVVVKPKSHKEVIVVRNTPACRYRHGGCHYRPGRAFAHAVADLIWWETVH